MLLAVPFSLIGAVWLLWLLDYNLSVAVWVGLIALAGLDAETGVVMLLYLTLAHGDARRERAAARRSPTSSEAIVEGAARRIRPEADDGAAAMTAGLLPLLWSSGTGADVMKRIAAPMVGGLVTSFVLELLVYPALFAIWKGREIRQRAGTCSRVPRRAVARRSSSFLLLAVGSLVLSAVYAYTRLDAPASHCGNDRAFLPEHGTIVGDAATRYPAAPPPPCSRNRHGEQEQIGRGDRDPLVRRGRGHHLALRHRGRLRVRRCIWRPARARTGGPPPRVS